jgi:uncharacterized protein YjbI with pentapeptide repeats
VAASRAIASIGLFLLPTQGAAIAARKVIAIEIDPMHTRFSIFCVALCAVVGTRVLAAEINGCPIRPATLCVEFDLRSAKLPGADLARADFSRSNLSGADLSGANLLSADLDQTRFHGTNLSSANLSRADLTRAELYGADLRHAQLESANLHSADLNGARLDDANLRGANLSGAHLTGVSMRNAKLERADLSGVRFQDADLSGADLTGAVLRNANLVNANLAGARLTGAVFEGANMRGCRGCPSASERASESALGATGGRDRERDVIISSSGRLPDLEENGCWARLYVEENFKGGALTLIGPVEVANVARQWGFPWEPMYESVQVGPNASLSVFDNAEFRERTMTFDRGRKVSDLDEVMGVFRTIRSLKVRCS